MVPMVMPINLTWNRNLETGPLEGENLCRLIFIVVFQVEAYREAFADFDWNKSGTIPTSVRKHSSVFYIDVFEELIFCRQKKV